MYQLSTSILITVMTVWYWTSVEMYKEVSLWLSKADWLAYLGPLQWACILWGCVGFPPWEGRGRWDLPGYRLMPQAVSAQVDEGGNNSRHRALGAAVAHSVQLGARLAYRTSTCWNMCVESWGRGFSLYHIFFNACAGEGEGMKFRRTDSVRGAFNRERSDFLCFASCQCWVTLHETPAWSVLSRAASSPHCSLLLTHSAPSSLLEISKPPPPSPSISHGHRHQQAVFPQDGWRLRGKQGWMIWVDAGGGV